MSKDYIGKKKTSGFLGLIIFCVFAFALTFVISYSVNFYRKNDYNKDVTESSLSKELDMLFEEENEENSPETRQASSGITEIEANEQVENVAVQEEETEETEYYDKEVSAKPEKAIIPLDEGAIIKNFNTSPEFSDFYEDWRTHTGVDIAGAVGDEVRTIADGIVVESYIDPIYGGVLKIDHGAFYSVYMGMDTANMEMNGTVVKRGDTIGLLRGDIVGESAEPHLHFEIIENQIYTDPMKYIG